MKNETVLVTLSCILFLTSVITTILTIRRDKNLNTRQKNNLTWLQMYFPFLGVLIYYVFFRKNHFGNSLLKSKKQL
jgi:hypothetical protein